MCLWVYTHSPVCPHGSTSFIHILFDNWRSLVPYESTWNWFFGFTIGRTPHTRMAVPISFGNRVSPSSSCTSSRNFHRPRTQFVWHGQWLFCGRGTLSFEQLGVPSRQCYCMLCRDLSSFDQSKRKAVGFRPAYKGATLGTYECQVSMRTLLILWVTWSCLSSYLLTRLFLACDKGYNFKRHMKTMHSQGQSKYLSFALCSGCWHVSFRRLLLLILSKNNV